MAAAVRVFDHEGQIHDQPVELQLKTLGGEVAPFTAKPSARRRPPVAAAWHRAGR